MVNRRSASESAMISFMVCASNTTCSLLIRPLARRIDSIALAAFSVRTSTPTPVED